MSVISLILMLASLLPSYQTEPIRPLSMPLATAADRDEISRPQEIERLQRRREWLKELEDSLRKNADLHKQVPELKSLLDQTQRDLERIQRELERLRKPKQ